jgi:phosphate acetyltransferase
VGIAEIFIQKAKACVRPIVFPEGAEPRIIAAARILKDEGICEPILVGEESAIAAVADEAGVSLAGISTVSPKTSDNLSAYVRAYMDRRNASERVAARMMEKPLSFGAAMVSAGDADGMVAGISATTAQVVMAAASGIGLSNGVDTPSSIFIMEIPKFGGEQNKLLVFADCAITIAPTSEQLADIAIASAETAKTLLGMEPKVALLSFSTKGSAAHAEVDKIKAALTIMQTRAPGLTADGEIQADAALVESVAATKAPGSPVAGSANILIFPDLNSGNIAYKLVERLAHANAYGPILQGFAKPVNDVSRGASVEGIIGVAAITAIQAQKTGASS